MFWESFDGIIFTAAQWSASMIRLEVWFSLKMRKTVTTSHTKQRIHILKGATKQSTPLGVNLCAAMLFRSATCVQSTSFRCIWSCAAGVMPPSTNVVQCSASKGQLVGMQFITQGDLNVQTAPLPSHSLYGDAQRTHSVQHSVPKGDEQNCCSMFTRSSFESGIRKCNAEVGCGAVLLVSTYW